MTKLIQWWDTFVLFRRHWPLPADRVPEWTEADQVSMKTWLEKPSGRKLIVLLRYHEQATNVGAVTRRDRHEYACGFAAGFRACAAWLQTISATVPPQTDEPQPGQVGAEALVDSLAP